MLNNIRQFRYFQVKQIGEILSFCQKIAQNNFPCVFLVFCVWIAHFLLSSDFGLYEDDWAFSGTAVTNTFPQNLGRLNYAISTFWQGRPLHMLFLTWIPFVTGNLGGIQAIYWVGFSLLSINTCLWYSLVKKITQQPYIALISSLFFCLYPADTTFKFIQHLLGIQTALLFILIAFHLYLAVPSSKKSLNLYRLGSYIFAVLSILNYESIFLVFLTAPLLKPTQTTRWQKLRHCVILVFILVTYLGLRKLAGESRMQTISSLSLVQHILYQITVGPAVAFFSFIQRPLMIASQWNVKNWVILIISTVLFFIILTAFLQRYPLRLKNLDHGRNTHRLIIKLLILGVLMAVLAYPSALLLSVHTIDGRASRVHFSAVIGISLIWGLLWGMTIFILCKSTYLRYVAVLFLSVKLSLLLMFSITVQEKYVESWQYQRSFWQDVVSLSPDMEDETVILVQSPNLAWGKQINPFDWSMPLVLQSIYYFPKDWQFSPRLYRLNSSETDPVQWQEKLIKNQEFVLSSENDGLTFYFPWEEDRQVDPEDIILLVEQEGRLVRKEKLNLSSGDILTLRPSPPRSPNEVSFPDFPTSPIFKDLISPGGCKGCDLVPRIYFQPQN